MPRETPDRRVRVAAVPAGHPYVAAVADPRDVDVLPDPPVEGAPTGQWWPPRLLDPEWLAPRTGGFDVLHLHFGLESQPVGRVERALDVAQDAGRPVVFTVHDLENPHLVDQAAHLRMLDAVVPRVDVLLTLTDAAARRVAARWGRGAQVVAHPRLHLPSAPRGESHDVRIGLHLRDLRPNIDALGGTAALAQAVATLRAGGMPAVGEVHLDDRVRDEGRARQVARLVAASPGLELHRHPRLDDADLGEAIARSSALVLPYAWGTHSGWVELAWDAAVPVVGTSVGAFAAQHPSDFEGFSLDDPTSLGRALERAIARPHGRPGAERAAERDRRMRQRLLELRTVRAAHTALYRDLALTRIAA